jgi:RNA methyltransferase, RsmE family
MTAILLRGADLASDAPPPLSREQARHLASVLRMKQGARLRIHDGAGSARAAEITAIAKHSIECAFCGAVETLPRPAVEITLFQCVAKAARMDWLLEKAVELGVARIVPVASERAECKLAPGEKPERWARIAESALCQSGAGWMPEIDGAAKWPAAQAEMRRFVESGGALFTGALTPDALPLGAELLKLKTEFKNDSAPSAPRPRIAFLIGPEGDLTTSEYESAAASGARPVTFGPQVLRVETAALFAVCACAATFFNASRSQ